LVQESLGRDPFAEDVFVFRGRGGSLIKALWHDGIGLSLYAKRLDRGRFVWPMTVGGVVGLTGAQMSYLLEAIDWRNPIADCTKIFSAQCGASEASLSEASGSSASRGISLTSMLASVSI
jgi:transposase